MLSKNQIKLISSLKQKKRRLQSGLFVVEGVKTIKELLQSQFVLDTLYTTESFKSDAKQEELISETELNRISFLKTPNKALAIFKIPKPKAIDFNELIIALDDVRDPGNLGAIIRLCDWFGVKDLVCSEETVDCYNPKVIQATMGSITRVNVSYTDLSVFLKQSEQNSYGAFMNGTSVYNMELPSKGILVLGNEANGISNELEKIINKKVTIPRFGNLQATESLNVATATAVLLSEFKRRFIEK
ncbi:TrmH family RNA methyltransferase [Yeosuana sp.]|uniref:TrmH family RNA methyltransferase n=1 Tax=Yeosuana sp. TaxID=2529388 RepID=UPI004054A115|tara:strand:- start:6161 stop:6892 length:732 start_codon:yes stop_codon:yes gene_type:complete